MQTGGLELRAKLAVGVSELVGVGETQPAADPPGRKAQVVAVAAVEDDLTPRHSHQLTENPGAISTIW